MDQNTRTAATLRTDVVARNSRIQICWYLLVLLYVVLFSIHRSELQGTFVMLAPAIYDELSRKSKAAVPTVVPYTLESTAVVPGRPRGSFSETVRNQLGTWCNVYQ